MKKTVLIILAFAFVYGIKAQVTGGGEAAPNVAPPSPKSIGLYLKFGISTPGGDAKTAMFKSGYVAEFGFLPSFSTNPDSKVKGGVIIADDFTWYKHELGPTATSESFSTLGMKVGPAIIVNPVNKFNIVAYYAVHASTALGKYYGVEQTNMSFSFANTFGINLKYSPFMIGLEFDSGKMKIQNGDKVSTSIKFPTTRLTIGFTM
jgi:hypothetical protein